MQPRSLGRRLALQYLYMADLNGFEGLEPPRAFLRERGEQSGDEDARETGGHTGADAFAEALIGRVLARRETIDRLLAGAAEHWDLARVAPVERNVLRIACAELMERTAPPKAILNEAVRLAKKFGGRRSGAFVNGLLDRIHHTDLPAAERAGGESEGDPLP
jgi:N utilization substance protein B